MAEFFQDPQQPLNRHWKNPTDDTLDEPPRGGVSKKVAVARAETFNDWCFSLLADFVFLSLADVYRCFSAKTRKSKA